MELLNAYRLGQTFDHNEWITTLWFQRVFLIVSSELKYYICYNKMLRHFIWERMFIWNLWHGMWMV
jgi:hypothetical protein